MTRLDKRMLEKNLDLIFEFEKYILEHPDFAEEIPQNAVVFMQLEGEERFNHWSQRLAEKHLKKGRPVLCVTIKRMAPVHSRIEELRVERAA